MKGRSAQGDFPPSRFNADAFYDPDLPGSLSMRGGYFLESDIRQFDNAFFGINNLEAMHMDPQQRNLLEVVFECFENAGVRLNDVAGANVGCYVGDFVDDYTIMTLKDPDSTHRYSATGGSRTILSNRISHAFDLRGPSLTLDTACSSSLYCLHAACRALLHGDCDSAIVASANLIQTPEQQIRVSAAGVLSNTSTCHTFDSTADGYGRGDAIGALYLKRLSDALRDNDPVRSIVRSVAINSDGQTPGITLPSASSQEEVITKAYKLAGLKIEDTDYFECHGTGTPVGDPIEVSAVANSVRSSKASSPIRCLPIGSVKPNFGHSEAASGITSIIKATLALENLKIPPTVGIKQLNPKIPWETYNVEVVQSAMPWPRCDEPHHIPRASINSFGYGGSNGHLVLDAAEPHIRLSHLRRGHSRQHIKHNSTGSVSRYRHLSLANSQTNHDKLHIRHALRSHSVSDMNMLSNNTYLERQTKRSRDDFVASHADSLLDKIEAPLKSPGKVRRLSQYMETHEPFLLPFSARTLESLSCRVTDLAATMLSDIDMLDLAYTLSERRAELSWRGFLMSDHASLSSNLDAAAMNPTIRQRPDPCPPLVFVFTGQGAQWAGMGKDLSERYPAFKQSILNLEAHLQLLDQEPNWSLSQCIWNVADKNKTHQPEVSQTACTALQIALVDLFREWGLFPRYVVGHSSGEIAAAYAAGHISATRAIEIAYFRGQALLAQSREGAMMAVGLGCNEVEDLIVSQGFSGQICVACVNSPESVTLSGDLDAIDRLSGLLQQKMVFSRKLRTAGKAYHSHHMLEVGETYEQMLRGISLVNVSCADDTKLAPNLSEVTMISSVLSRPVSKDEVSDPCYWRTNLESRVLFSSAVQQLLEKDARLQFLEIGPHGALGGPVKQISTSLRIDTDRLPYLSALSRNSRWSTLSVAGSLWTLGYPLSLAKVNCIADRPGRRKPRVLHHLPNYRWRHTELLWAEPRASVEYRQRKFPRDELLGSLIPGTSGRTSTWRNVLDLDSVPWLRDHRLGNDIVFPGAGYIVMASRACQQILVDHRVQDGTIEIRDMQIEHALKLDPDTRIEVFCELSPRRLNGLKDYSSWYHFTISTFQHEQAIVHSSGDVGLVPRSSLIPIAAPAVATDMAEQRADYWYPHFSQLGLNFGPDFRSLRSVDTPRMRKSYSSGAKLAQLSKTLRNKHQHLYNNDIHPVAIDAVFQTGIIASCAGEVEQLSAHIPVYIERIQIGINFEHSLLSACRVRASANIVGYGIAMLQGELLLPSNKAIVRFDGLKAMRFKGSQSLEIPRQPMLRVVWHPDMSKLRSDNLSAVSQSLSDCLSPNKPEGLTQAIDNMATILRILSHGRSNLRILEIGTYHKATTATIMKSVNAHTSLSLAKSYHFLNLDTRRRFLFSQLLWSELQDELPTEACSSPDTRQLFDVVICGGTLEIETLQAYQELISNHLAPDGMALFLDPTSAQALPSGLTCLQIPPAAFKSSIILALPIRQSLTLHSDCHSWAVDPRVQVIVKDENHPLNRKLLASLEDGPCGANLIRFDDMDELSLCPNSTIVVTAELEEALLKDLRPEHLVAIQRTVLSASSILWVTGGNLIASARPDFSAAFGLRRVVVAENPALKFAVIDLDQTTEDLDLTVSNLQALLSETPSSTDSEYLQRNGVLYVSRMVPDTEANSAFREKQSSHAKAIPLHSAGRCEVSIREPGQFETLVFTQLPMLEDIPPDHVEVNMKAAGINAKVSSHKIYWPAIRRPLQIVSAEIYSCTNCN